MVFGIASSVDWRLAVPLNRGWSTDQKYIVETEAGERLLLRTAGIDQYDGKIKEYEIIQKYSRLGFPMSLPLEFGVCDGGRSVYMLLTWVEGKDLEEVLPGLPEAEQYRLGREAGEILKRIHSIPLEARDIPQKTKREKKLRQLARYEESRLRVAGDEEPVRYVRDHIDRIWRQAPVYQHGDFHPGNLIYQENGKIGVIDFNRWEVGDPYEEFYKLESFGRELSIPYCIGQIDAYFDEEVPEDFWTALAVYVAQASLYSIKWAEKFGQEEIEGMTRRCLTAMEDYDGFRRIVPKWYKKTFDKFII